MFFGTAARDASDRHTGLSYETTKNILPSRAERYCWLERAA
jgi:hypothetical protein